MDKRQIGQTGVWITPLMFGTSGLGHMPDTYGYGVDETRARATLGEMSSAMQIVATTAPWTRPCG